VISSNGAVRNEAKPKSIVVIGAGAVAWSSPTCTVVRAWRSLLARALRDRMPIGDERCAHSQLHTDLLCPPIGPILGNASNVA